jgi:hypothetical protein
MTLLARLLSFLFPYHGLDYDHWAFTDWDGRLMRRR